MQERKFLIGALALVIGLAGCGAGSDEAEAEPNSTTTFQVGQDESDEETPVDASGEGEEPDSTVEPGAEDKVAADWSGPEFLPLVETRMDELGTSIGQPYSADAVGSIFAMPGQFPTVPGAVVTGVINSWDVDSRDGEISQTRIVGTDSVMSLEDLEAFASSVGDDANLTWKQASVSDGGTIFSALFVSEGDFEPGARLVMKAHSEPMEGAATFNWELEVVEGELSPPAWMAGLPFPEGGEFFGYREGIGGAEDFGTPGGNGFIDATMSYSPDSLAVLKDYFATDVLEQAGFVYEDTPFNNQNVRIDVSMGAWVGRVSVFEARSGDEILYYGVGWQLRRELG